MIETNIATIILVLIIWIIRCCFKQKVGWKYLYALWLVIPLRLFVFSFIKVQIPLWQLKCLKKVGYTVSRLQVSWEHSAFSRVSPYLSLLIWLLGFLIVLICSVKKTYNVYCFVKKSSRLTDTTVNGLRINLLNGTESAFLFAGTIYVSETIYKNKEWMKYVILHETEHKRQMDHLWDVVRILSLCFFWYNPFVWLACLFSKQDSEFSCDERVAEKLSETERRQYCKALLEIVTKRTYEYNESSYVSKITGGKLKSRITNLCVNNSYNTSWKFGITVIVCLLMIITLQGNEWVQADNHSREPVITVIDIELASK